MGENNTKIKYLRLEDKMYKITDLSFFHMAITAEEIQSPATTIPEDEIWDINFFKDYHIKLINKSGQADIVDFTEWKSKNRA